MYAPWGASLVCRIGANDDLKVDFYYNNIYYVFISKTNKK